MDDAREELSGIDRALARALDVDASPDFEARVRRRIADEPMRVPFWRGWRLAVPLAAAAALVAAAGVAMLSTPGQSTPRLLAARTITMGETMPAIGDPVRVDGSGLSMPRVSRRTPPAPAAARANAEPEVLVPPGQEEALRRFVAGLRAEPGTARPLLRATATVDSPVPPPPLIHIPVLASEPLSDPADPLERSKS